MDNQHLSTLMNDFLTKLFAIHDNDFSSISDLHRAIVNNVEKILIQRVMLESGNNKKKSAQILGISRTTLDSKLASYNKA